MGCGFGGGLWRALLLLPLAARGQVSVLNGLSHFQPCDEARQGSIHILNQGDSTATVLLQSTILLGQVDELVLPSEVQLAPGERRSVPFRWEVSDSLARHAQVEVFAVPSAVAPAEGTWTVVTEIHYLLNLYTGCLDPAPSEALHLSHDNLVYSRYDGQQIWKAMGQAYTAWGQTIGAPKPFFFFPGAIRTWRYPEGSAYILLEDESGHVLGYSLQDHAH
jgi:hypothetical protein